MTKGAPVRQHPMSSLEGERSMKVQSPVLALAVAFGVISGACSSGSGSLSGTGGSSSSGAGGSSSGGGSCSNVAACGGSVVGTWTVMSSCLKVTGELDLALAGLNC